ncbi:tRNA (adenosine(37)-N6)-threonylcarbamoyltransferase complex ATPase subunit type 1 TsaE [Kaistia geumhonensis]|uniref:tRNA threonylcarbamoyladenosine biosynthesis protein TsaE n=1 Tax=Kaistia geumhonensis TaxID=410839 RepID=A0ABU0M7F3_9HYPH|nr:tRNA (adenosine(37)-N6)-threonylcarbamoyltransferase complex ATPase subunit type 1 TsaE [Kaistia geumhonensis]MCX5477888.1 tRNA (adenosine(37)-N6)-threonylcarbamoyltransferase complex ATPase subunit type 1 TsaE [Kaistia geumhonensis]MDQ0516899.1 tRNA threonylcarbamoyl adenosine modification protein YjeE [Kaistia geumhonensis]
MSDAALVLTLADEAATHRLAEALATRLAAGDVIALEGDLGAGKTTLARALIRAVAGDPALEVPSPTFTLVQTYPGRVPIAHFDLYRLGSPDELDEIGFEEAVADGAVLIEWPERGGGRIPRSALTIRLDIEGDGRRAALSGGGAWPERLDRLAGIARFLDDAGFGTARRAHLAGDASGRSYERLVRADGTRAVLMDARDRLPGPPVWDGRSYDDVAHRATTVLPFVAMNEGLRAIGISAPRILAADIPAGLLLLEDLGDRFIVKDGAPRPERWQAAAELLAHLHAEARPAELPVSGGERYSIPAFDRDAFLIEVDLLPRWYAPLIGRTLDEDAEAAFRSIWTRLFERFDQAEKSWLLRDYHSPNLLWLPERTGIARIGVLDHQDAMIGASAYDLASLGQDVRVDVDEALEQATIHAYVEARRTAGAFDGDTFAAAYAISGAQRTTKILGGFARLANAFGRPQYLRHIPRVKAYLKRNLRHEVLSPLALWYDRHLPLDD